MKNLIVLSAFFLSSLAHAASPKECTQLRSLLAQQKTLFHEVSGTNAEAYREKMSRVIAIRYSVGQAGFTTPELVSDLQVYNEGLTAVIDQNAGGPLWEQINAALDVEMALFTISLHQITSKNCGGD